MKQTFQPLYLCNSTRALPVIRVKTATNATFSINTFSSIFARVFAQNDKNMVTQYATVTDVTYRGCNSKKYLNKYLEDHDPSASCIGRIVIFSSVSDAH